MNGLSRAQKSTLATVLVVGAALRLHRAFTVSMWSDEYHSVRMVNLPFRQLISGTYTGDLNPPLYYLALKPFLLLFGESELVYRMFSVICSVIVLFLMYRLTREMFPNLSRNLAIGSTALLALNPLAIIYAAEIRAYSFLLMISLLALWSFFYSRRQDRPNLFQLTWVLAAAASAYTHYFGILVPVVIGAMAGTLILQGRKTRESIVDLLLAGAAAALFLPGAVLYLFPQLGTYPVAQELYPPGAFLQVFTASFHSPRYEPLLIALALVSAVLGWWTLLKNRDSRPRALALLAGVTVTIGAALAIHALDINIVPRYLLHIAPLLFIPMAAPLLTPGRSTSALATSAVGIAAVALFAVAALDLANHVDEETALANWKTDWEEVSERVAELNMPAVPLVLTAWDSTPLQFYLQNPFLRFNDFQQELTANPQTEYLIVLSENTPSIPLTREGTAVVSIESESVQVILLSLEEP